MELSQRMVELKKQGTAYCVATVVKCEGSSPRHVGAKMIVTADETFGTVGGGGAEHQSIKDARELLRHRKSECRHYELNVAAGTQPCGGSIDIFYEVVTPLRPMIVFGAGHCAEPLCPMLMELGYEVTLVDDRAERLSLPAFENVHHKVNLNPMEFLSKLKFSEELHIICITHAHTYDEAIIEYCLDKPFRYLGLISSRTKWAVFRERYLKKGHTEKEFARVSTPIGLDIGAETPFEIAVAIAGELIRLHGIPA